MKNTNPSKLKHIILLPFFLCFSCINLEQKKMEEIPEIDQKMPLNKAIEAALEHGDKTLQKVKTLVSKRNQNHEMGELLHTWILQNETNAPPTKLINSVHLYKISAHSKAPEIFTRLSSSDRSMSQQLSWHLAAALPTEEMAKAIEKKLTQAITDNEISQMYWPKMAESIANNKLIHSYTILREGLNESNHVAFARAMILLKPTQASYDFMNYLAKAPIEELRQLNLSSVDIFSCIEILEHLQRFPVAVTHPRFEHLFFFAISRNTALAELSKKALSRYFPNGNNSLALTLARMPNWVQIAFVEGVRRQLSPQFSLFLRELKVVSSQKDVIEEINHIIR